MALMSLQEYAEQTFTPKSIPDKRTLQRWCKDGLIVGAVKMGGLWFIDTKTHKKYNDALIQRLG